MPVAALDGDCADRSGAAPEPRTGRGRHVRRNPILNHGSRRGRVEPSGLLPRSAARGMIDAMGSWRLPVPRTTAAGPGAASFRPEGARQAMRDTSRHLRRGLGIADLGDLVELPLLGVLATYRLDGSVLLSPVWHEWRDDGFSVVTNRDGAKARHLRR